MVYGRWRFGSFRPVPLPRAPPARRGWAHARDYVEGMWLILQQEDSDDYVLATGETRSGREFVEKAFKSPGAAQGCTKSGRTLVEVDPRYFRPTEVDLLVGDPTKARQRAGLASQYIVISFEALVAEMVHADLCAVRQAGASSQPPRALRMVR